MADTSELRDRASDWMIIGPVLGFTDAQRSRVLVQPHDEHAGMLELRVARAAEGVRFVLDEDRGHGAFAPVEVVEEPRVFGPSAHGEHGTVIFELEGLEPDTRYFYEVVPEDAPREVAGCFASRQPFCLRTLPADPQNFCFSFHSCNGVHHPPRRRKPTAMWRWLLREAMAKPKLHFAVLGGDQIYADVIREQWLREWEPDFDPAAGDPETDAGRAFLRDLPRRYEQIYRAFWRRPEIRTFMGHVPCLMTWDDHDIYDGWGSYGDEHLPAQQAFFRAAATAFDAFQFSLSPRETLSAEAAAHREGHRAFSFMVGEAAFVILDLRSQRNIRSSGTSAVLGDEQWAWLKAECAELCRRKPRQIVVVSSVPVLHMGSTVEHLMPSNAEMYDDVLDHWNSRPNRNDQARLLGNLFRLRKDTGANVLILGGDVHVGTVGELRCDDPRYLVDGEPLARIYQGVSSAIAYEAPQGISGNFVRWMVQREHDMRGAFSGCVEEVVTDRNFAVVSLQEDGAFRFTLYNEGAEVPDQFYMSPGG